MSLPLGKSEISQITSIAGSTWKVKMPWASLKFFEILSESFQSSKSIDEYKSNRCTHENYHRAAPIKPENKKRSWNVEKTWRTGWETAVWALIIGSCVSAYQITSPSHKTAFWRASCPISEIACPFGLPGESTIRKELITNTYSPERLIQLELGQSTFQSYTLGYSSPKLSPA